MMSAIASRADAASRQQFDIAFRTCRRVVAKAPHCDEAGLFGARAWRALGRVKNSSTPSTAQVRQRGIAFWHERGFGQRPVRVGEQPFRTGAMMQERLALGI